MNQELANVPADDLRDRTIDVYPNPASNYFVVYNYSSEAGRNIELYDITGRILRKETAINVTTKIDVSNLPGGIYILKINNAKGKSIRQEKIVVQR
ncbi:MAG: T9SS type A sorting domain-containing protein [Chitinophagaceae bacterium]